MLIHDNTGLLKDLDMAKIYKLVAGIESQSNVLIHVEMLSENLVRFRFEPHDNIPPFYYRAADRNECYKVMHLGQVYLLNLL